MRRWCKSSCCKHAYKHWCFEKYPFGTLRVLLVSTTLAHEPSLQWLQWYKNPSVLQWTWDATGQCVDGAKALAGNIHISISVPMTLLNGPCMTSTFRKLLSWMYGCDVLAFNDKKPSVLRWTVWATGFLWLFSIFPLCKVMSTNCFTLGNGLAVLSFVIPNLYMYWKPSVHVLVFVGVAGIFPFFSQMATFYTLSLLLHSAKMADALALQWCYRSKKP